MLNTMKKIFFLLLISVSLFSSAQKIRFGKKLQQFCEKSVASYATIPNDRKTALDNIASDLAKKNNITFTCKTNTRRTQLLQTWMQTAFYFYGIETKTAWSFGDTVSEIAPGVINVLKKTGFGIGKTNTKPAVWIFNIGNKITSYAIYPKVIKTAMSDKDYSIVSICNSNETSLSTTSNALSLPYESPVAAEKAGKEIEKYSELNRQIATEMLYLAEKTKQLMMANN